MNKKNTQYFGMKKISTKCSLYEWDRRSQKHTDTLSFSLPQRFKCEEFSFLLLLNWVFYDAEGNNNNDNVVFGMWFMLGSLPRLCANSWVIEVHNCNFIKMTKAFDGEKKSRWHLEFQNLSVMQLRLVISCINAKAKTRTKKMQPTIRTKWRATTTNMYNLNSMCLQNLN